MHKRIFEIIARPGIDLPHEGLEAELMLHGNKPVALLAQWGLPGEPEIELSPHMEAKQRRIDAQIARLDEAVSAGRLVKNTVIESPPTRMASSVSVIGHYYCQPDKVDEMNELAAFFAAVAYDLDMKIEMPKEIGLTFGYTQNDIEFWDRGGYDALDPMRRFVLQHTKGIRRYCRARAMMMNAEGP